MKKVIRQAGRRFLSVTGKDRSTNDLETAAAARMRDIADKDAGQVLTLLETLSYCLLTQLVKNWFIRKFHQWL